MLKGLQYVGNANGLSVMLYKSYKSVTVSWDKPYRFTPKDNISDEARKYYQKNYYPLGVRLVEEVEADSEPKDSQGQFVSDSANSSNEVVTPESDNVVEETQDNSVDESNEVEESINTGLKGIIGSLISEYGKETIESASVGDLGEILDSKFDESQIKELCSLVGYDYGRTKSKSKIINGLLEDNSDKVVSYILA